MKAVLQTLVNLAPPILAKEGVKEFEPMLSSSESEPDGDDDKLGKNSKESKNPGSKATYKRVGKTKGTFEYPQESSKKKEHQPQSQRPRREPGNDSKQRSRDSNPRRSSQTRLRGRSPQRETQLLVLYICGQIL